MRLAPRLALAFGMLVVISTGSLGAFQRAQLRSERVARFGDELHAACLAARDATLSKADADRELLERACASGELVDRTLVALERGDIDERRVSLAQVVPRERAAFDLDELLLASDDGDVFGMDPLRAVARAEIQRAVRAPAEHPQLRAGPDPVFVVRCRRHVRNLGVALVGTRRLATLLSRLSVTSGVSLALGPQASADVPNLAQASCAVRDRAGTTLALVASRSTRALEDDLARMDQTLLGAIFAWTSVAFLVALGLARSISRPIAELASEARKVAKGEARPVGAGGSGEIRDLRSAFDAMLADLDATRRRLAATTRVAAWREVARQVAHEVKNPLAPIRAAVETLRRLRARNDPRFDDYFDEATRTVLEEVLRISTIVTEFTRFARLPAPQPADLDLVDAARHVLALQKALAPGVELELSVATANHVRADRDQIIQVLTNLVQNAVEAGGSKVLVAIGGVPESRDSQTAVAVTVSDDGPGIAPAMAARLFEPYASTKAHGTGLGLAISQRIALEHDGELSYAGGGLAGRGASFRLILPNDGPAAAPESTTGAPSSGKSGA